MLRPRFALRGCAFPALNVCTCVLAFVAFQGLSSLVSIGTLTVFNCALLTELSMPALQLISAGISVTNLPSLVTLDAATSLGGLRSVRGTATFQVLVFDGSSCDVT